MRARRSGTVVSANITRVIEHRVRPGIGFVPEFPAVQRITSGGMLDGRIYRTGLIVAALALVVLGFSLRNQQAALSPTLSPAVFNGENVAAEMTKITQLEPNRQPGSFDDENLATA